MAADLIRPFPEHCPHGGGYILRAALAGCATVGNPVPSQAEHLTSADVSRDFKVFRPLFPRHDADAAHVVVEQGLLVSIVPLKSHPRPVIFSDRGLVVLVVTPTYPGSDVQQSGTASRSFISPFRCDSIGRHHRSCLPGRLPRPSIPQCVAMLAWGKLGAPTNAIDARPPCQEQEASLIFQARCSLLSVRKVNLQILLTFWLRCVAS